MPKCSKLYMRGQNASQEKERGERKMKTSAKLVELWFTVNTIKIIFGVALV